MGRVDVFLFIYRRYLGPGGWVWVFSTQAEMPATPMVRGRLYIGYIGAYIMVFGKCVLRRGGNVYLLSNKIRVRKAWPLPVVCLSSSLVI